jgi:tetratricopeptide (TPR) repeat protein
VTGGRLALRPVSASPTGPEPDDAERLLALSLARPAEALARARATLDASPSPRLASIAHQAANILLRDFGDIEQAITHLRAAVRFARLARDPGRVADVRASLGIALTVAGRPGPGLAMLDAVGAASSGLAAARHLVRRAHVLWLLGRNADVLRDARRAVLLLVDAEEPVWLARAYNHRAMAHLAMGAPDEADAGYVRCVKLYAATGQEAELATAIQERGQAAFARGDLPTALAHYADAQRRVDELGVFEAELHVNRCAVLLAAGLPRDALAEADGAVTVSSGSAARRPGGPSSCTPLRSRRTSAAVSRSPSAPAGTRCSSSAGSGAGCGPHGPSSCSCSARRPRATARPPCWGAPGTSPPSSRP